MGDLSRYLRPGTHIRLLRRLFREVPLRIVQFNEGRSHVALATRAIPSLNNYAPHSRRLRSELLGPYQEYVSSVSTIGMAVTLEYAVFLRFLCGVMKPRRILDTGSGFSSFVLRSYQASASSPTEVWSVDDSPAWLDSTKGYLEQKGLSTDHLLSWDQLSVSDPGSFALISHDLGSLDTRARTLEPTLNLLGDAGLLILDDVDKPGYMDTVREVVARRGCPSCSLRAFTKADRRRERWRVRPVLQPPRYAYLVGAPGSRWDGHHAGTATGEEVWAGDATGVHYTGAGHGRPPLGLEKAGLSPPEGCLSTRAQGFLSARQARP